MKGSRIRQFFAALGAIMALLTSEPRAAEKVQLTATEWQAVTLAKVLPYVKWPEKATTNSSTEFVVGILGKDPVGTLLEGLLAETKVMGREVKVKTLGPTEPLANVQVVFVPEGFSEDWQALSERLDSAGVLTVGVAADFTKTGGVIHLRQRERQLVVNLENARKADLSFDSKLLRICIKEK